MQPVEQWNILSEYCSLDSIMYSHNLYICISTNGILSVSEKEFCIFIIALILYARHPILFSQSYNLIAFAFHISTYESIFIAIFSFSKGLFSIYIADIFYLINAQRVQ